MSTVYKLLQSSSPCYLRDLITVQPPRSTRSSALVILLQPPVDSSLEIPNCFFRYDTPHLWKNFLLLFVFFISSIHHHHSALLHRHALNLDRLLTFLVAFSTLVLELCFSQSLSLHCHLSLFGLIWYYDHSLFGSH